MQSKLLPATLAFVLLSGCQNISDVTADLEGKREASFLFWAKLQGFQYRGNAAIKQFNESNRASAKSADVEATAEGFSKLSAQHADMARQLAGLDAENVDEVATRYRDQLVKMHQAISGDYQRVSEATHNRDTTKLLTVRQGLYDRLRDYVDLWKQREAVMARLSEIHGGDFNVQD